MTGIIVQISDNNSLSDAIIHVLLMAAIVSISQVSTLLMISPCEGFMV